MANPSNPRLVTERRPALYTSRGVSGGGITPRLGTSPGEIARPGPSLPGLSRFRPSFRLSDLRDVPIVVIAAPAAPSAAYPDRPIGYGLGWGIGSGLG